VLLCLCVLCVNSFFCPLLSNLSPLVSHSATASSAPHNASSASLVVFKISSHRRSHALPASRATPPVCLVRFLVHLKNTPALPAASRRKTLQSINLRRGDLGTCASISVERRHAFCHRTVPQISGFLHHRLLPGRAGQHVMSSSHTPRPLQNPARGFGCCPGGTFPPPPGSPGLIPAAVLRSAQPARAGASERLPRACSMRRIELQALPGSASPPAILIKRMLQQLFSAIAASIRASSAERFALGT